MKKYAIILAGGSGMRAGGDVPKQFQMLDGIPMLWWSVRAFYNEDSDTDIRLVMNPGFFDLWNIIYRDLPAEDKEIPVTLVCGGRSRLESVKNGIMGCRSGGSCYGFIASYRCRWLFGSCCKKRLCRGSDAAGIPLRYFKICIRKAA